MSHFLKSETGAVTVDWVVLTAGLVGLGLATTAVVSSGVEDLSGDTRDEMTGTVIKTSFGPNYTPYLSTTYNAWFNLYMIEDEDGFTTPDATLANTERNKRWNAMAAINAGDRAAAEVAIDSARGVEAAGYERGVELLDQGATYEELEAAFEAEFGT